MSRCPALLLLLLLLLLPVLGAGGSPCKEATPEPSAYHEEEPRIVGGEEVVRGEVPFLVSLQDLRYTPSLPRHFCGGVVYDATTIITAAHCVSPFGIDQFQVVAGEHDRSVQEGSEQTVQASEIILHPQYDVATYHNDIAIIKLSTSLHFGEYVQPVSLPPEGVEASGGCMVTGWGALEENGEEVNIPHKVVVPVWSDEACRAAYSPDIFDFTESMLCAGYDEGGKDACHSDSGSPLICYEDSTAYLGAVVSWGFGCARPRRPSVYTELTHFRHWVKDTSRTLG